MNRNRFKRILDDLGTCSGRDRFLLRGSKQNLSRSRTGTILFLILYLSSFTISYSLGAPSELEIPQNETSLAEQTQLLDEIQKRALNYLIEERNPQTGLIRDWAWNKSVSSDAVGTVAGIGFALTAYGVGVERGWLDRGEALEMTKIALQFLRDQAPQEHGFFYHFMTMGEGNAANNSEVSPIDTALALAGVLFASEYFEDPEIKSLAHEIYERVDWAWMLNGGKTFALAWNRRGGFTKARWDNYNEGILIYLLALGATSHPIPPESWQAIRRPIGSYGSHRLIQCPPLFTHQYPHIWIDFRNKNDGFADYFANSRKATLTHRQFALDQSEKFKSYGPDSWGFTAAEGPSGYKAYGAPPGWAHHDGTIVPTACVSSIAFTPEESIRCINHLYKTHGKLWGRYGFSDAFNVDKKWYSNKAFAINQGPMILMVENNRSGLIWKVMNRSPVIQRGLQRAGFRRGTLPLKWEEAPVFSLPFTQRPIAIDGETGDWPQEARALKLDKRFQESGEISNPFDLSAAIRFAWDLKHLYFVAEVRDDSHIMIKSKGDIWRDDLLELFIDPQGNGLYWHRPSDLQIGFRAVPQSQEIRTWSWFQGGTDPSLSGKVRAKGFVMSTGYVIEGAVAWSFLGIEPRTGMELRLSPAIHDIDRDKSEAKLIWFFRNEDEEKKFQLGRLVLAD
ncbi:MAG: hypothetical protein HY584_04810 [Candidatus Omnitrophica bacterium]|nr:hypothetical protein [Candidatus Omnitrophota bacterium]